MKYCTREWSRFFFMALLTEKNACCLKRETTENTAAKPIHFDESNIGGKRERRIFQCHSIYNRKNKTRNNDGDVFIKVIKAERRKIDFLVKLDQNF